jgi:beta-fructofuranosidase
LKNMGKSKALISHESLLEQANRVLAEHAEKAAEEEFRLHYHFMPPANWMNDPNGLIQFNGEYHLFYQHDPYSAQHGPCHWGHASSVDLVNWKHLLIALAPSELYDIAEQGVYGCWSGSAVNNNGTLTLIYTGHVEGNFPEEVQCLATSIDGISFIKYNGNPVIGNLPEPGCIGFRDPKVWRANDSWNMVIGSGKNGRGRIFLYESADLLEWTYRGIAAESDGSQGDMWECPDLFPLGADGKHILIVSPMNIGMVKTMYLSGEMNYETGRFTTQLAERLDFGSDCYAPQTFMDDQGRRILIGWMDNWGSSMRNKAQTWFGAMTIPRELKLAPDGTIRMIPVAELTSLRRSSYVMESRIIEADTEERFIGIYGNALEIIAEFYIGNKYSSESVDRIRKGTTHIEFGLKLCSSEDDIEETIIGYKPTDNILFVDTIGSSAEDGKVCTAPLEVMADGTIRLHIYIDRSSLEVFANDGRRTITERIYPHYSSTGIKFYAIGEKTEIRSVRAWNLQSIW